MASAQVHMCQTLLPAHTNHLGDLSPGQLLKWIDITAFLAGKREPLFPLSQGTSFLERRALGTPSAGSPGFFCSCETGRLSGEAGEHSRKSSVAVIK